MVPRRYGFRNYRNVYSNGTSNYDIETYIDQLGFTVTDDPAKADIIVGNVALDQGEKGAAAVAAVKAGTPYIATGSDPLEYISKNLVTDLTYTTLGMEPPYRHLSHRQPDHRQLRRRRRPCAVYL